MDNIIRKVKNKRMNKDSFLSKFGCKSKNAIQLSKEDNVLCPVFLKDIEKIMHSLSYTRYIDKTQVFSFEENDHITHRVLHVQLVSRIGRTIGRALKLNEDLIEAIALGHDVGHAPFGHKGENYLNEICKKEKIGCFCHNAQGVRLLKDIENKNISIQTLDGILAHNGELIKNKYEPNKNKSILDFNKEMENAFINKKFSLEIMPMTLEGCVVRISDVIAYIGRDIQDAQIIGTINENSLPKKFKRILGKNNEEIENTLILDLIKNSYNKPYLMFSVEIFKTLVELLEWNTENIYYSDDANRGMENMQDNFNKLFDCYLKKIEEFDWKKNSIKSEKFDFSDNTLFNFANNLSKEYKKKTDTKRMIIDFIAGQTDDYFVAECRKYGIIEEKADLIK